MKYKTRQNSLIRYALVINTALAVILFVIIFFSYRQALNSKEFHDNAFIAHFQSRQALKAANGVASSRAFLADAKNQKSSELLANSEDTFLGAYSNFKRVLVFQKEASSAIYSDFVIPSFEELMDDYENLFAKGHPLSDAQKLNAINLKLKTLHNDILAEEATLWSYELSQLERLDSIRLSSLHTFYAILIGAILAQVLVLYYTINKIRNNQKDKLRQTNLSMQNRLSTLGLMSTELTHEINSPLMVIDGRLEMLKKVLIENNFTNEKTNKNIEIIKRNSYRIQEIIKNFKAMATSNSHDGEELELVKFNDILIEISDFVVTKNGHDEIKFTINKLQDDCYIFAKKFQIVQVLTNLINNSVDAIKGTPNPWIEITPTLNGQKLSVSVIDSGKGIASDVIDEIFTPFYTTKPPESGTGLGLSISKKIMREHGGDLIYNPVSPHTEFIVQIEYKRIHSKYGPPIMRKK